MPWRLPFEILPQPDDTTCGPTCLHAIYRYYGEKISLKKVIAQTQELDAGGTLAVFLGRHALQRGYHARIYSYNLHVFDPTWFTNGSVDLRKKLKAQRKAKSDEKLALATAGYLDFLELGGEIRMRDLTARLIRDVLNRQRPILTGLSATYLYQEPREYGRKNIEDDVRGGPAGHFVVLCGYNPETREVRIADPLRPNPFSGAKPIYRVPIERVLTAILLGVLTSDANLLIIEPARSGKAKRK